MYASEVGNVNASAPQEKSQSKLLKLMPIASGRNRHCEERSDEAIQRTEGTLRSLDCFASLAMTIAV
jgi:hypothetical protein